MLVFALQHKSIIMNYVIKPYSENDPMKYFQEICSIPHGSGNEKQISEYIIEFAKSHNLEYQTDELYNVIVKKDGQGKGKNSPAFILQGHTDMVCEKNNDTEFDFTKDSLNLMVEDGWLKANGTTLGADNGVAVAYMMSALAEETLDHPPLECLFTVQEETGLDGAKHIDVSGLKAKKMLNMDAGPQGVFYVSSAGGLRIQLKKNVSRESVSGETFKLSVSGLFGGHSGVDIASERGNANHITARILYAIQESQDIRLISVNGGDKDNAIPRECFTELVLSDVEKAKEVVAKLYAEIKEELQSTDSGIKIELQKINSDATPISKEQTQEIIKLMFLLPNGPFHRNLELNNLVMNSSNFALIKICDTCVEIHLSIRSGISSLRDQLQQQIELVAKTFGFECSYSGDYPAWQYNANSELREKSRVVYNKLFGSDPEIVAIHAGLECGILAERIPGLDILAIGPTEAHVHTPDEKVHIQSFQDTYKFIKNILEAMC